MRGLAMLLAAMAALLSAPQARAESPVTYTVSPRFEHGTLTALEVEVALTADPSGQTRLRLPDHWMGHDHLWRNLHDLTVDGAASVGEDGDTVRVIRSPPGRRLAVRYALTSSIDHQPTESDSYPALPWVLSDWFYVDAASALPSVEGRDTATARLRWKGWPRDYRLDSSFTGRDVKVGDLHGAVLIGGRDLKIAQAGEVRLAIHGKLDAISDEALVRQLQTILRAERAFFGETARTPYLITAAALRSEDGATFSGVGKMGAFGMAATPNLPLEQLLPSLAHEFFHAWIPGRLGAPLREPRRYWFSEGFTDFYARRFLVREGLITPKAFIDLWNEMLRAYGTSPVRTMSGEAAGKAFWTDPFAEKLPYQRGALLAVLWDERLRAGGASLDDVLRAQAKVAPDRKEASPIDLLAEQMARHGIDIFPDIEAFAKRGEPIRLTPTAFAPCADVIEITVPTFDLGFTLDVADDGTRKATRLRPDSPAARAGLRDGDTILEKLSGTSGDSTIAYVLRVKSADAPERTVRFLPEGAGAATYQQLRLRPEAVAKPALCAFRP